MLAPWESDVNNKVKQQNGCSTFSMTNLACFITFFRSPCCLARSQDVGDNVCELIDGIGLGVRNCGGGANRQATIPGASPSSLPLACQSQPKGPPPEGRHRKQASRASRQAGKQANRKVGRQANEQICKQAGSQASKQAS